MKGKYIKFFFLLSVIFAVSCGQNAEIDKVAAQYNYEAMQRAVAQGWNTWDTRSVLRHVLLPCGAAIDINLASADGKRESRFFIGNRAEGSPRMRPGAHSYDGYYTDITAEWNGLALRVESAADSLKNVIIITPQPGNAKGGKVIVSTQTLWERATWAEIKDNKISIKTLMDSSLKIGGEISGKIIESKRNEMLLSADEPIVIACDKMQGETPSGFASAAAARAFVDEHHNAFVNKNKQKYGACYDEYNAMQNVLGWDNIYDPTIRRVITPVSRIWNVGWSNNSDLGGFVLFCWDTYFASMMLSTDNKELAYANAVEITRGITEQGFVPNFYTESDYKSRDRSQPPVGTLAVWNIYQKYGEKWFLELLYDDLLRWNRWWDGNRKTDGLLCWGSTPFEPVTYRWWEFDGVNATEGGALESGLDNSQMYDDVPFDKERHQQQLNDVGLSSLYIMDCHLLAKIAEELGQRNDAVELRNRGDEYAENLKQLWDEADDFYYNRLIARKDSFSVGSAVKIEGKLTVTTAKKRISPTNFYPLLANVPTDEQAEAMLQKHLLNPEEFWGEWVIPATPRNDPAFDDNSYWRGRIWAPLNFLVYMGIRNYDTPAINEVRSQLSEKSRNLLLKSWLSDGYVFENYNATTGQGDDVRNSDKFYHWGALLGFINLIENGYYYNDK
ncbi:MAG: hypothetical protein LBS52_09735 [Dysgonamonadaceae bacterium]|jgi:hypothetical protein|nr:hypothetical protein [Dysgonamonadaceae bacterium]